MPKKITLDNLAKKIDDGFKKAEKHTSQKIDEKIDQLALAVKKGFDGVDKRFDKVDKRFDKVELRLDNLEQGQEEIKLKLDQVAYRFEIQELDRRLKRLEIKLGIK